MGNFLSIIGHSALAVFYFVSGYFIVNELSLDPKANVGANPGFFETMLGILSGVFIAVSVIGLMFYIQEWPGGVVFLILGNVGLMTMFIFSFWRLKSWKAQPLKAVISRSLLFIVGTVFFALVSFII